MSVGMQNNAKVKTKNTLYFFVFTFALLMLLFHWFSVTVKPNNLLFTVTPIHLIGFFETRYLYAMAHLFAIIPVFCLSFDKKVAYYTRWKYVFPAIGTVAIPFWIWDIAKTARGVWGFNPTYYTHLFINLPIEEWLFFITFPWATVFIYDCLNAYFPLKDHGLLRKIDFLLTPLLIFTFFLTAFFYRGHLYTFTTFFAAGVILTCAKVAGLPYAKASGYSIVRQKFYRMFPIALVPFILINGIFTGAFTHAPIVVYNPEEYLGIRFFTIPMDDFVYNFLLTFSVITLYERKS